MTGDAPPAGAPEATSEARPEAAPVAAPDAAAEAAEQLAVVRGLVSDSTHRLLGHTIGVDDDGWRAPSRLPGWSRGHVATHVARQADALVRLCRWAQTGQRQDMYGPDQRDTEIEAGAGRPGLELQVDLDTSAQGLEAAFADLDQAGAWDAGVELRGGAAVPARLLPLARLTEVVLHHVDLDVGFEVTDIDTATAEWLLEWSAFRLRRRDEFPALQLSSDSGFRIAVGSAGEPRQVSGSSALLLGWLTGRSPAGDVQGTDGLTLPSF